MQSIQYSQYAVNTYYAKASEAVYCGQKRDHHNLPSEMQSPWDRRHPACLVQTGSLRTQVQTRCLRSQDFSKSRLNLSLF